MSDDHRKDNTARTNEGGTSILPEDRLCWSIFHHYNKIPKAE